MKNFINWSLDSIESRNLVVERVDASAGCYVTVFKKDIVSRKLNVLGGTQVVQEYLEATLRSGEKISIPNVKLSYDCDKKLQPYIPEVESMLTNFLTHINTYGLIMNNDISQEQSKHL